MKKINNYFTLAAVFLMFCVESIAATRNNELYYTTSDGKAISFSDIENKFNVQVVSNNYKKNQGVIKFKGDLTEIGRNAFYNCPTLVSVTLPNSVIRIGKYAFSNCESLNSITLSNNLKDIGDEAFESCSSLFEIKLPSTLTSIGALAFSQSGVKSINIGPNVTNIGGGSLSTCEHVSVDRSNTTFDSRDNCEAIIKTADNALVIGTSNSYIPSSVTSIGEFAFAYSKVKEINIPSSVVQISKAAFYNCKELEKISIPSSVTTLGSHAFTSCANLDNIILPSSISKIDRNTFQLCESLKNIEMPGSITEIGTNAFAGCKSLSSITIPSSVTRLGDFVFNECTSITSIEIPNSVVELGSNPFGFCSSLKSLTLSKNLTSLTGYIFDNLESLSDVYVGWSKPIELSDDVFEDCDMSKVTLHCPKGTSQLYKKATGWKHFGTFEQENT